MSLPQVYASEDELARTDAIRQTRILDEEEHFNQTQQQQQQMQYYPPRPLSQSVRLPSPTQRPSTSVSRTYGVSNSYTPLHVNPYSHVQRPQTGIRSIPKEFQPKWQDLLSKGPHQYMGDTFSAALRSHSLSSYPELGHSFGPQTLKKEELEGRDSLPDAHHRQAWACQPTFRWFKRSDYESVNDRWAAKEGMLARGDNHYRPPSVAEHRRIQQRVDKRIRTKGMPRTGEW